MHVEISVHWIYKLFKCWNIALFHVRKLHVLVWAPVFNQRNLDFFFPKCCQAKSGRCRFPFKTLNFIIENKYYVHFPWSGVLFQFIPTRCSGLNRSVVCQCSFKQEFYQKSSGSLCSPFTGLRRSPVLIAVCALCVHSSLLHTEYCCARSDCRSAKLIVSILSCRTTSHVLSDVGLLVQFTLC